MKPSVSRGTSWVVLVLLLGCGAGSGGGAGSSGQAIGPGT